MKNTLTLQGRIKMDIVHGDGTLEKGGWVNNTITNAGKAELANLAGAVSTPTEFTYLAVGTDNTAPAATQTALVAEIADSGLSRAVATVTRVTTTVTNDTLQLYKEFSVTGTKAVEEAGIFNASSAGTMLGRALTTTKSLVSGDKLQLTYQVIFS